MSEVKKCSKCKEEIKSDANKCKHCGADFRNWFVKHKVLSAILGFILLSSIISAVSDDDSNTNNSTSNNGDIAAVCAQNKIETMLKSPSSAKFPWGLTSSLISGNKYRVANYVDSQNSFGAMIRTNYTCDVVVNNPKSFDCDASCVIE